MFRGLTESAIALSPPRHFNHLCRFMGVLSVYSVGTGNPPLMTHTSSLIHRSKTDAPFILNFQLRLLYLDGNLLPHKAFL